MFHLSNVEIRCFCWKLWLSAENVLMAGLQWLTKVGILNGKQMIPSQSSFPLRQTFNFLTEQTRTVLMEGIWPDLTSSSAVWSTTDQSVCGCSVASRFQPSLNLNTACCWKIPAESWGCERFLTLLYSATAHWESTKCFPRTAVFMCSLLCLHTGGTSHQRWQALTGQPQGQIWFHPSFL